MPQIYEECDRAVAGSALMRRGYRMQYMSVQTIWIRCEDLANVIFLGCARHHHQSDFDSVFVLETMNGAQVRRSLLLLNYLSNSVFVSCECHMYHLSEPQVLCPGRG